MKFLIGSTLVVFSALTGPAFASGDRPNSGDEVKAIETDRARQKEAERTGTETGRSAAPDGTSTQPLSGKESEETVLEGVDPAIKRP